AYPAVVSIGTNPTFSPARFTIEAHLLDFAGDLYGESIRVLFLQRLRDEMVFPHHEPLRQQIQQDIQAARAYFRDQDSCCLT
ncbi:riboflavin biosynthesis protein RibF, partial [candidate division KSB3 bacterium]|nr:riboflavin biosynthesis protein RibF [candidate division KSB3 bacterium]MBD3327303.1 riboflavin biosynthesis protein RibF [candidate division KSB3 bacterium]